MQHNTLLAMVQVSTRFICICCAALIGAYVLLVVIYFIVLMTKPAYCSFTCSCWGELCTLWRWLNR